MTPQAKQVSLSPEGKNLLQEFFGFGVNGEKDFKVGEFGENVADWEGSYNMDIDYMTIEEIDKAGLGIKDDTVLHLDPIGRITCFTCHNPHLPQLGHLRTSSSGAEKIGSGVVCAVCHSK